MSLLPPLHTAQAVQGAGPQQVRILDQNGSPIQKARMYEVSNAVRYVPHSKARRLRDGTLTQLHVASHLKKRNAAILVVAPGYATEVIHANPNHVTLRPTDSIIARCRKADGSALAGVRVCLSALPFSPESDAHKSEVWVPGPKKSYAVYSSLTDGEGIAVIDTVPSGTYIFSAHLAGWAVVKGLKGKELLTIGQKGDTPSGRLPASTGRRHELTLAPLLCYVVNLEGQRVHGSPIQANARRWISSWQSRPAVLSARRRLKIRFPNASVAVAPYLDRLPLPTPIPPAQLMVFTARRGWRTGAAHVSTLAERIEPRPIVWTKEPIDRPTGEVTLKLAGQQRGERVGRHDLAIVARDSGVPAGFATTVNSTLELPAGSYDLVSPARSTFAEAIGKRSFSVIEGKHTVVDLKPAFEIRPCKLRIALPIPGPVVGALQLSIRSSRGGHVRLMNWHGETQLFWLAVGEAHCELQGYGLRMPHTDVEIPIGDSVHEILLPLSLTEMNK